MPLSEICAGLYVDFKDIVSFYKYKDNYQGVMYKQYVQNLSNLCKQ